MNEQHAFLVLHTLQDFYSHSNWVELGYVEPFSNLLRADLPLENLAGVCLLYIVQTLFWVWQGVVNCVRHMQYTVSLDQRTKRV